MVRPLSHEHSSVRHQLRNLIVFSPTVQIISLGFSQGGTLHSPTAFAAGLPDDAPIVLVFGAMATGSIDIKDHPYVSKL